MLLIHLLVDNRSIYNLPNNVVSLPKRASAREDEGRNKKNSREECVPIVQHLQIFGIKGAIVCYRVLCLQTRQTKAARTVFPSENTVRSPWAINLCFVRHIEDRACPTKVATTSVQLPESYLRIYGRTFDSHQDRLRRVSSIVLLQFFRCERVVFCGSQITSRGLHDALERFL